MNPSLLRDEIRIQACYSGKANLLHATSFLFLHGSYECYCAIMEKLHV